jgi:hypothetical protein
MLATMLAMEPKNTDHSKRIARGEKEKRAMTREP